MAWSNGTMAVSERNLSNQYPVKATDDLWFSRDINQRALQSLLPDSLPQKAKAFVLPLKRFMHKCPVCGIRTLTHRGLFEICPECGWEDAGVDGEDEESFFCVNGDYTIRRYRDWYLKKKATDPSFASESAGFQTPMDEEEP